jgi:hypothetical protein
VLKDRPGHRGNLIQANVASINRTPFNSVMLAFASALFAVRYSARKALFLEVLKASIIGRKLTIEVSNRVSQVLWDCLPAVHDVPKLLQT